MRRFKGFTLTELMIALAVIGILVAVVTPAIMKTRPNKNKMMVKKTFYTTEQIVSTLINDERLYPDMRDVCGEGVVPGADPNVYCAYGFDYREPVTYEGVEYSGASKFAMLFKSRLNVKRDGASAYEFYTTDGVKWNLQSTSRAWRNAGVAPGNFDDGNADGNRIGTIIIDVNGDEEPNARQSDSDEDSFDTYHIQILSNGKMRIDPADSRAVDYATINTSIRDTVED